jgi:hypothetical protein
LSIVVPKVCVKVDPVLERQATKAYVVEEERAKRGQKEKSMSRQRKQKPIESHYSGRNFGACKQRE